MAEKHDKKSFELDSMECQWVAIALENQAAILKRKRASEHNPEIAALRSREVGFVNALKDKFQ